MGLVDLLTDLENFKYGMSSPDKVDGQIESGVDFFDDLEGGAVGFTTQAEGNLLSQYNKFIEGEAVNIGSLKNWDHFK